MADDQDQNSQIPYDSLYEPHDPVLKPHDATYIANCAILIVLKRNVRHTIASETVISIRFGSDSSFHFISVRRLRTITVITLYHFPL